MEFMRNMHKIKNENHKKIENRKAYKVRILECVLTIFCVSLVTGCAVSMPTESTQLEDTGITLEQNQSITYNVPESIPNVLVDQNGYEMKSTKTAIFRGDNLQTSFEVIDADTGETVYTGDIIARGIDEKTGEYISFGAFSELEKEGTYYIQTAVIGQSYPFVIQENLYIELIPKMEMALSKNRDAIEEKRALSGGWYTGMDKSKNVSEGCGVVQNLLLSSEFYPLEMSDDVGIKESGNQIPDVLDETKYEIDWLQKMQNPKTGGVYEGVTVNGKQQAESFVATADFASAMAAFYCNYVNYDKAYARKCLQMAEYAWKYLQGNELSTTERTEEALTAQYNAAAQLFKATNNANYHIYIKNHYDPVFHRQSNEQNRELYGDVAYLTTTQRVDTGICKELMDKWMDKAEKIVEESKKNSYFVIEDTNEKMLNEMLCLAIIDHVITNHEYVTVLESHLHYFCGRNTEAVSYIEEYGEVHPTRGDQQPELTKQSRQTATLLFMLGEIITEDTEEFGE